MMKFKWSILSILLLFILTLTPAIQTKSCTSQDEQFLITFHPHLDAFWLNFDNELKDINFRPAGFLYNMNQRNSKTIFNSMLEALLQNKDRKYFVTQSVFFKDWYDFITPEKRQQVKTVLLSGQLEIANGAWVQNDQAVCYYDDILDQYSVGHNFLYKQFNYQVKIAWATDSFGHSHSQAALQHLLGIQFQGIQRVDDRYVNEHFENPLLQFYWSPISDSNNLTYGGVLNHVRHFLHEVNNYRGSPPSQIVSDYKEIENVMRNKYYRKNKLFRFLGNDFQQFIPIQFDNLEKAMKQLNLGKSPVCPTFKYGNPSDYLQLITKFYDNNQLPVRIHDLIPNWDQDRYWTGYYTTDPQLKKACKDFSRLINFYRKTLLMQGSHTHYQQNLNKAQQLLAVVQHHDGITATSKTYIQDQFRNRMRNQGAQILNNIAKLHGSQGSIICKFHENQNQCQIADSQSAGPQIRSLYIITHGGSKQEKVQIGLPSNVFYDLEEVEQDIFCDRDKCVLVFQANLHPGVNKFTFTSKTKQSMSSQIFQLEQAPTLQHNGRDFTILVNQNLRNQIKYTYGDDQYFNIGIYQSPNQGYSRQSVWWNKYGRRQDKSEYIVPGMYIMANNARIQPAIQFTSLKIAQGKIYKRVIAISNPSKIKITILNDQPNIIDVVHDFKPQSRSMLDYFMKVSTSVKSSTLYHDSNGFLVAKRILNHRPDYQFKPVQGDQINGNTYPVCSFAYLLQNNKKFVFFTDRAQGVAAYKEDLLINFDRLAMDDGKGVGQGYGKMVSNTFRYKFALVSSQDDIQRTWQKAYDEALIGFLSKGQEQTIKYTNIVLNQIPHSPGLGPVNSLKYSIFFLNKNQFVLRLQNLAQLTNLQLNKPTGNSGAYQWNFQQLGFKLKFYDYKQSYANGIPIQTTKWRRHWGVNKQNQINILTQGQKDSGRILLRPLEIRSFRINLVQSIIINQKVQDEKNFNLINQEISHPVQIGKKMLRKRCF